MNELYVLSDSVWTPNSKLFESINELLDCGVKFIQYRNKNSDHDVNLLKKIANSCDARGAKFIINDDPNLAKITGAHGVHIGRGDGSLQKAREILGDDAIIGVSCYDDLNLAEFAAKNGASYVAFGAMFASKTKPFAPLCDFSVVKKARESLNVKIAVIGGINASNSARIRALNADFIAVVSAAYTPGKISENIANLKEILEKK